LLMGPGPWVFHEAQKQYPAFFKNLSGAINSSDVESGYKRMRFKELENATNLNSHYVKPEFKLHIFSG